VQPSAFANREQGVPQMIDTALSALVRAWATTVVAILLLLTGLAVTRAWDGSLYLQEFQTDLYLDQ
jgi:hypothetical protein